MKKDLTELVFILDIKAIVPMSDKEYFVRGCTALLDAVGGAIHHIGNIHKYACEEDRIDNDYKGRKKN